MAISVVAPQVVIVALVTPDSPAERAGVKEGDRLSAISGTDITNFSGWELRKKLATQTMPFTLTYSRDGKISTVVVGSEAGETAAHRAQKEWPR